MKEAFLIIISLLASAYSAWTKQWHVALGFLTMAIGFVLAIQDLAEGIWGDALSAMSLVIFTVGVLLIIFRKRDMRKIEEEVEGEKK